MKVFWELPPADLAEIFYDFGWAYHDSESDWSASEDEIRQIVLSLRETVLASDDIVGAESGRIYVERNREDGQLRYYLHLGTEHLT